MWVWIVFGLALLSLVTLVFLFYFLGNSTPTHKITISNTSSVGMTVRAGTLLLTQQHTFDVFGIEEFLQPNSNIEIQVTPGVALSVFAWEGNNILPMATAVFINLPAGGYFGPYQIRHGEKVITLPEESDLSSTQAYTVSLISGANVKASITPSNPSCEPIKFESGIPQSTCPAELRYGDPYSGCMSACWMFSGTPTGPTYCCFETGVCSTPCQNTWPDQSFYQVFKTACPDCAITNCDLPKPCDNSGTLNGYHIEFDRLA